jgi:ribosomal protein S18 acetylase RimI-like enzyme
VFGGAALSIDQSVKIRLMEPGEAVVCEKILRALPNWFGIEESIVEYAQDIKQIETWVAYDGKVITGFLTLNQHNDFTAEIHVIGVRPEFHGKGIGRALVEYSESLLRQRAIQFFEVKTLGPSRPDAHYDKTRKFYTAMGFCPLEENKLWGDRNPCLIMIKHLG